MDINYFLLMRNKYIIMVENLDSIINAYDDICDYTNDYDSRENTKLCILFISDINIDFFIKKRKYIQDLKNTCNQHIYSLCKHEFINDSIDIDPDTSKTITYCRFCELNSDFK